MGSPTTTAAPVYDSLDRINDEKKPIQALNAAIKDEDYSQAAKIRDRIAQVAPVLPRRPS